jgi:hypothetical protein
VRERLGVVHDPERAPAVAADAIRLAAEVKNNPPDLINVALEMLVKASLELPAFSTLDEMASQIRREVNTAIFEQVASRIGLPDRVRLQALLEVAGPAAEQGCNSSLAHHDDGRRLRLVDDRRLRRIRRPPTGARSSRSCPARSSYSH